MEGEESGKGSIVYREAPSNSFDESGPYVRNCGKEVSNDGGTSERHLSSREDVADEGSYHY